VSRAPTKPAESISVGTYLPRELKARLDALVRETKVPATAFFRRGIELMVQHPEWVRGSVDDAGRGGGR